MDDIVHVIGGCKQHQQSCDWYDGCTFCPGVSNETFKYDPNEDEVDRGEPNALPTLPPCHRRVR